MQLPDGDTRICLFVVLRDGMALTEQRIGEIKAQIRANTTPRCVASLPTLPLPPSPCCPVVAVHLRACVALFACLCTYCAAATYLFVRVTYLTSSWHWHARHVPGVVAQVRSLFSLRVSPVACSCSRRIGV